MSILTKFQTNKVLFIFKQNPKAVYAVLFIILSNIEAGKYLNSKDNALICNFAHKLIAILNENCLISLNFDQAQLACELNT